MCKVFSVSFEYDDNPGHVFGGLFSESHDIPKGYTDDEIYHYGTTERNLKDSLEKSEPIGDGMVVLSYHIYDETDGTTPLTF